MISTESINAMLDVDYQRQTQVFITEAIKEWDKGGEGNFDQFLIWVVMMRWVRMAGKN